MKKQYAENIEAVHTHTHTHKYFITKGGKSYLINFASLKERRVNN